jgi:hypothetical protein
MLRDAELSLVISPPTNDGSTLILVPLDVFLACLDVTDVSSSTHAGDDTNPDDGVRGDVRQPYRLVVDAVNNLARVVPTSSNSAKRGRRGHTEDGDERWKFNDKRKRYASVSHKGRFDDSDQKTQRPVPNPIDHIKSRAETYE